MPTHSVRHNVHGNCKVSKRNKKPTKVIKILDLYWTGILHTPHTNETAAMLTNNEAGILCTGYWHGITCTDMVISVHSHTSANIARFKPVLQIPGASRVALYQGPLTKLL